MKHQSATKSRSARALLLAASATSALCANAASAAPTLEGWASMPATTTAVGPTSGQFGGTGFGANSNLLPIVNGQPVQGFSAVLCGPRPDTYYVMPDNGFGAKPNSADALLRMYAVRPNFKTWNGRAVVGSGSLSPAAVRGGRTLPSFSTESFLSLRDPDRKLGFTLQADYTHYYNVDTNPAVDPSIIAERLLTGADFDIESVRRDKFDHLWFGEEFGPFLVKTDKTGKVLRSDVPLPNIRPTGSTAVGADVQSPQNPYLNGAAPNLGGSRGFEGMAINTSGDKLYTLLEGTVTGDAPGTLRIDEFDIRTEQYTGRNFLYALDAKGTNIGDMTAINDRQFLVLERNGETATTAGTPFKHVFLIDLGVREANGTLRKTDLIDLMNIADPHDLNGDGSALFTFPYVTIESILPLDARTLLILNDNNFPGGGGRSAAPDITEFLLIRLDQPLEVSPKATCHGPYEREAWCDEEEDDEGED